MMVLPLLQDHRGVVENRLQVCQHAKQLAAMSLSLRPSSSVWWLLLPQRRKHLCHQLPGAAGNADDVVVVVLTTCIFSSAICIREKRDAFASLPLQRSLQREKVRKSVSE